MTVRTVEVTIPANSDASNVIGLGDNVLVGLQTPEDWTAADICFQVPVTYAENFYSYVRKMNGDLINCEVASNGYYAIDPNIWLGVNEVRLRSGSDESSVDQEDERIIVLYVADRV